MKILFLSSDKYPPFRVDVSLLFGKHLAKRNHQIDWVLQSEDALNKSHVSKLYGGTVYIGASDNGAKRLNRLRKNLYDLRNDLKIFCIIKKKNYDIVIIKDKFISPLLALIASRLKHIKFIYWLSYPFPEWFIYEAKMGTARYPLFYLLRGYIYKILLYRIFMPFADHIFVQSEQMKNDIAAQNILENKITPVLMGIDDEEIPFVGYKICNKDQNVEKNILYLGTLIRIRKIDFLLYVFKRVLKKEKSAQLYLVGGSEICSDEEYLKEEAVRLGISDSVHLTGWIPQILGWEYIKKADVCISPYFPNPILNSTSPTKLIEYMAMGKAVVANDHPEQRQVLNESRAGICVPWAEREFAKAILSILSNPKEAERMGIRGRKYVEKYRTYSYIADVVESKLMNICKNS